MEVPQGSLEFLAYLQDLQDQAPTLSFPARATRSDELPRMFNTLPAGDVYLYGQYAVFLTLENAPAGQGLLWKQFAQQMGSQLKQIHVAYKAATNPASLLLKAATWLVKQFKNEDLFAKALMNPNSLFIPLDDVTGVETGRKLSQGNYVCVTTRTRTFMLCQNIADHSDTLVDLYRVGRSMFTKKWQPEFVAQLNERAQQNRRRDAA